MKPFQLSEYARGLNSRYLSLSELRDIHTHGDYAESVGVCRAWITEGIPCAFSEHPLLFEKIRELIANSVNTHPRDITLVGSARTGYSLNPRKLGNEFSARSDLDLAVISQEYFSRCEEQFLVFKDDYEAGRVTPDNPTQARLWPEIISDIDRQRTERDFVDICKIPTKRGYATAQSAIDACWRVREKLNATEFGPSIKKCSLRVYKNNYALIRQNNINLRSVLGETR